ncbi:MAG: DinB family protein, partial [Blastocatellia bacterium]
LKALTTQIEDTLATLRGVSENDSLGRYEPGKWSLREVVGHMIDTERVFAYRALCFARNEKAALPGFEQDDYAAAGGFDRIPWASLLSEFELLRGSNVFMFRGLAHDAWSHTGIASDNPITVRALAYNIAGHELHHMKIVRERYLSGR